jgi:hypothetical protein
MSNSDSDSDFDSDFEIPQDLLVKMRENVIKERRESPEKVKELRGNVLDIKSLESAEEKFSKDNMELFDYYVQYGNGMNEAIRSGVISMSNVQKINGINKAMKVISDLFPKEDFIVVFRTQRKEWTNEKNQSLLSTSDRLIPMSEYNRMRIIIPKDIKVGIINISHKTLGRYEIILPTNTSLIPIEFEKNSEEIQTYIVNSEYYRENKKAFANSMYKL